MAKKKLTKRQEQEELIKTLKFVPCTYKIVLWGYGGEKVMGTTTKEVWDYCMDNQVDLVELAWSDEETVCNDMGLDPDLLPFPPGSWYECDNIAHINGVGKNAGTLEIIDDDNNEVLKLELEDCDVGEEGGPEFECYESNFVSEQAVGRVVFVGSSNEKGTFFEGDIELTAPFDIAKLKLIYEDVDGEEIISMVSYDGVDIDNYGGSTDGKSSDMDMYLVTEDGTECYAPEEKDWGHPAEGPNPSEWERTAKIKFKKQQPVYPGWYMVNWSYGSSYGSLYWNGEEFGEWEHGKFVPVYQDSVVAWSGYSWDTSDWANRPAEPAGYKCESKKCDWTGGFDDMIDGDDGYTCPKCGHVGYDWIDYDIDTARGRKNRERVGLPADKTVSAEHVYPSRPEEGTVKMTLEEAKRRANLETEDE